MTRSHLPKAFLPQESCPWHGQILLSHQVHEEIIYKNWGWLGSVVDKPLVQIPGVPVRVGRFHNGSERLQRLPEPLALSLSCVLQTHVAIHFVPFLQRKFSSV